MLQTKKKQQRPPKSTQCWKTFKRLFSKQSNANHLQKPSPLILSAVMKLSSPRLQSVVCAGNFNPALLSPQNWALKQLWNSYTFYFDHVLLMPNCDTHTRRQYRVRKMDHWKPKQIPLEHFFIPPMICESKREIILMVYVCFR